MLGEGNIIPVDVVDEMKTAYIDYSMSVIVSRALPDVRDGLKPVQRRVLFGMNELGLLPTKPHKKSARIVGEVLGKYHPHGDSSVYEAMVRMAQPWSLRYPFVDGQGNFGSIDGDSPAAMRYTEARLMHFAVDMLTDIDKDTMDFVSNFDESLQEPTVLPAKLPNLLINGTTGIAVGMATNMPPHNIGEVINGIIAYIDNPDITLEELMTYIPGPDFPTGGIILNPDSIKDAYATGKGRIILRGKVDIQTTSTGKTQIIITEIPYMVNKASMIERIAQLVNEKKIDGISDIRDESDKEGLRIVIDLKRDTIAQVVLNNLFANTALQSSYCVNNVALVNGQSKLLTLKNLIYHFYQHRHEVVTRRTNYELKQAQNRLTILEGYTVALQHLDQVLNIIKSSHDASSAQQFLHNEYNLTDLQTKAILDLKLQRLTGLEQDKILKEYQEITNTVEHLTEILSNDQMIQQIIKEELIEINNKFNDNRLTEIKNIVSSLTIKDIVSDDEIVITLSQQGYIKRTLLSEYRLQHRGGVGAKGSTTIEDDIITYLTISSMHQYLLAFTNKGKVYWKQVYELPEGSKQSKGRAIPNVFPFALDESLISIITTHKFEDVAYLESHYVVFCTKKGIVKRTLLSRYSNPRVNGIYAININEGDELVTAKLSNGNSDVIIASRYGKAIRFHEAKVREMGRTATGVKGLVVDKEDDHIIGMVVVSDRSRNLLVVSEKGFGKRSQINDYRITNRDGKGIKTINITQKTGFLTSIEDVSNDEELIIINNIGIAIRMPVKCIRTLKRNTQGVTLIKLAKNTYITSISKIAMEE